MEISSLPSHLPKHLLRLKEGDFGKIIAFRGRKMGFQSYSGRNCHTWKTLPESHCADHGLKSINFDIEKSRPLEYSRRRLFAIKEPLEADLNNKNEAEEENDLGLLKINEKELIATQGVGQVLHMVGGNGEISYAKNSRVQSKGIIKAKPVVEEAVKDIYKTLTPNKFVAVDLACSSGSNTFLVISEIINTIDELSRQLGLSPPEIQMFLNDLPGNDFNNIFRSLTEYEKQVRVEEQNFVPFYVAGSPGSFYTRLFPAKSVHFFHSSYAQIWLSKVPRGIDGETCPYLGNEDLYKDHFREDFSTFLNLRSKELISGGRMVLTISGRRDSPNHKDMACIWGLLTVALNDMILEGHVEERERKAAHFPYHTPSMEEIKAIVETEGSFSLEKTQTFELSWDPYEENSNNVESDYVLGGRTVANYIRAAADPMLDRHFDKETIDRLFSRYAEIIERHLKEKPKWVSFVLDLKLKE